jgi:proteasome lid subunit RPN8/RPN11
LARASTGRPVSPLLCPGLEHCWTLVGRRRGRIWYGRRVQAQTGERVRVHFDGPWVLDREERFGDVLGFYHTHPDGPALPSRRDVRTMRAWCSAFGKALLCVIDSPAGVHGFRFADDDPPWVELAAVECFPRGVVIGVDGDGGKVSS